MESRQQELQKAITFIRSTFAERQIGLDYTPDSVKYIDKLFDDEFRDGKLRKPEGSFAKFQGLIMIGISGYLAAVIVKHVANTRIEINEEDQNWFINFAVTGEGQRSVQPGQQVLKRIQYGENASLEDYVKASLKFFQRESDTLTPDVLTPPPSRKQKPWWKFW